jgi:HSP20 family protein
MTAKKETELAPAREPFGLLRQLASEFDRVFDDRGWPAFRWPAFTRQGVDADIYLPKIDVFEKDGRLITKIDLPGLKKEDVKVEVADGHLAISGERKIESEEKKEHWYRAERGYGSFSRVVPLPEGAKVEEVTATFADGVLEVSVPVPVKKEPATRHVQIEDGHAPKAA